MATTRIRGRCSTAGRRAPGHRTLHQSGSWTTTANPASAAPTASWATARTAAAWTPSRCGPSAGPASRAKPRCITRTDRSISYRQIPWAPRPAHTIDGTGATWCAPSTANYELLRLGAAGDTVRVALEAPPLPVSAAERDSVIREIESRGPTGLDFSRIPKAKPAILRLSVDDRNRLWVRRDKAEGGILFDIITSDGRHEATVSLDGVRTSTWAPFVVRGDVVLLVIVGEDDVPQVGRFVIDRGR